MKRTILIIDDSKGVQTQLRTALESFEKVPDIVYADTGVQGLQRLAVHNIDLVLCDLVMPGIDGFKFLSIVKQQQRYVDLPVILLTARDHVDDKVRGLALGAVDYLTKPFHEAELRARVSVHLRMLAAREREQTVRAQLRAANHLNSVGQLAAGMAHEINTPLQILGDSAGFLRTGIADLRALVARFQQVIAALPDATSCAYAEQELADELAEVDLEFLDQQLPTATGRLDEAAQRIGNIIRAVEEFARPTEGSRATVALTELLDGVLSELSPLLSATATVEVDAHDLPDISCAPDQIHQVLANLLRNAAQATAAASGRHGQITIQATHASGCITVEIRDNGAGIPDELLDRVFEPFFTTRTVGDGAGLGLSIAHSLVAAHGGKVTLDSLAGEGTTVQVELPVAPAGQ